MNFIIVNVFHLLLKDSMQNSYYKLNVLSVYGSKTNRHRLLNIQSSPMLSNGSAVFIIKHISTSCQSRTDMRFGQHWTSWVSSERLNLTQSNTHNARLSVEPGVVYIPPCEQNRACIFSDVTSSCYTESQLLNNMIEVLLTIDGIRYVSINLL